MRGQVLEKGDETLVVCVGQADGAQVGQVLDVIRHKRRIRHSRAGGPRYRRENVGQVRIAELLDSHYAEAEVISGRPTVNEPAELIRPSQARRPCRCPSAPPMPTPTPSHP